MQRSVKHVGVEFSVFETKTLSSVNCWNYTRTTASSVLINASMAGNLLIQGGFIQLHRFFYKEFELAIRPETRRYASQAA